MKTEYRDKLLKIIPSERVADNCKIKNITTGDILLKEGEIATKLFIIIKGCLRKYYIKESGIEITSQFFIEGQMVSAMESSMTGIPSRQYIDAIEDSVIGILSIKHMNEMLNESDQAKDFLIQFLLSRLTHYVNQQASYILDNPEKRYVNLLKENPELISRIPQQYIASYLGITPVSLSRIRSRIKKQINNC